MWSKFVALLLGCPHRNTTWPRTLHASRRQQHYVVCNDCGRALPYDWNQMKRIETGAGYALESECK